MGHVGALMADHRVASLVPLYCGGFHNSINSTRQHWVLQVSKGRERKGRFCVSEGGSKRYLNQSQRMLVLQDIVFVG